jgi:MFS family permease
MYIAEIYHQWRGRAGGVASAAAPLPATVYALGGTSLLTDVSSEMVASVLPVYLLVALRLSPAQYGVVDGLLRGGAAVAALLLGGVLSNRSGRAKLVAGAGYTLSALTKIVLLASAAFGAVALGLVLDRLGKGLRVAPRDAMLAASVPSSQLGLAFGVHRAMDAIGAVVGPLLAAGLLWLMPDGYRVVFGLSLVVAAAGLLVFFRFVREAGGRATRAGAAARPWRARIADSLPAHCRPLLALAMLLTLFTVSEGMVYAHMQRSLALAPYLQALLPVASASCFLLLAAPLGWLADRLGRVRVFCGAHLMLLPLYGMLALAGDGVSLWPAAAMLLLLGAYVAATDGVLMAAVAERVPAGSRAISLGVFAAGLALMKLASSSLFGWLWDRVDLPYAVLAYAIGLLASLLAFAWFQPWRAAAPALASMPD